MIVTTCQSHTDLLGHEESSIWREKSEGWWLTVTMKLEVHLFYVGGHSQVMVLKTRLEVHNP